MSKLIKILSIDGGGIRGILPGQILVEVEKMLQEKTDNKDARIADHFDFFAGTSTGGILTAMLLCPGKNGRPMFTAKQAVDLYMKKGGEIFSRSLLKRFTSGNSALDEKYSEEGLEKALNEYLGDIKLSELLKPCLITAYEIERRYCHFFSQHDALTKPGYDFYLRDVARATSAAPTYFQAAKIKSLSGVSYSLVDGGVFANNPALCAFSEAGEHFKNENPMSVDKMIMLSLGTGTVKKKYNYEDAKDWGAAGWIKPILDIMMSGVSDTVEFQLGQIFQSLGKGDQYLRINPDLGNASSDLDDVSSNNLVALKEAGIYSSENHQEELSKLVDMLIKNEFKELPI